MPVLHLIGEVACVGQGRLEIKSILDYYELIDFKIFFFYMKKSKDVQNKHPCYNHNLIVQNKPIFHFRQNLIK